MPENMDACRTPAERACGQSRSSSAGTLLVIVGTWLRHGGLANAGGAGVAATELGQLTGLFGAYAVLLELVLMSRLAWSDGPSGWTYGGVALLERFVAVRSCSLPHGIDHARICGEQIAPPLSVRPGTSFFTTLMS